MQVVMLKSCVTRVNGVARSLQKDGEFEVSAALGRSLINGGLAMEAPAPEPEPAPEPAPEPEAPAEDKPAAPVKKRATSKDRGPAPENK